LLCSALSARTTHIVGGELTYRCLGNDLYEINLEVYRDCFNGVPPFDNPASIGIFDSTNQLVFHLQPTLLANDTLEPILTDPCSVVPPNVCVHRGRYKDTITLPFFPGGYQMAYQRCCRNRTILNIVNPSSTGATFYSRISEDALRACNSSPQFKNWPPIYICAGQPLIFDHSAIDVDGDSLVYTLCSPFNGASTNDPRPQPPNGPPYVNIIWDPAYGLSNVLGGVPLTLNSSTGLMTAVPNTIGQFVVGVCVAEYRNGELIGELRRDFQYNVGQCGRVILADFYTPDLICRTDRQASFLNASTGTTDFLWKFGDPANTTSTSNFGLHTYPDTGKYQVKLIAGVGDPCDDSIVKTIDIQYPGLIPEFKANFQSCIDSVVLKLDDLSIDTIAQIANWNWRLNNGSSFNSQNVTTQLLGLDSINVWLALKSTNGCQDSIFKTIPLNLPNFSSGDTIVSCVASPVYLNTVGDTSHQYSWTPSTYLNDPNDPNPIANPPTSQWYKATVPINSIDTCTLEKNILVFVTDTIHYSIMNDTIICNPEITLFAGPINQYDYSWSLSRSQTSPIYSGPNPILNQQVADSTVFHFQVNDQYGCIVQDSVEVLNKGFNLFVPDTLASCFGDTIEVFSEIMPPNFMFSYLWSDGPYILNGRSNSSLIIAPQANGNYNYNLLVTNSFGCADRDTMVLDVFSNTPPLSITASKDSIYLGDTVQLNATNNSGYTYRWIPRDPLSDHTIHDPIAGIQENTTFFLRIRDLLGCINTDSISIYLKPFVCDAPYLFVPSAFTPNGDGKNDQLFVRGNSITDLEFVVYSRWGEKVFEAYDLNTGWDGKFKGKELPPDVYGYYLKMKCYNGDDFIQKGNVTLLR